MEESIMSSHLIGVTTMSFPAIKKVLKKQFKPLSSIESVQEYGITKKQLHSLLTTIFHFPAEYRTCLSRYQLLHWEGKYFEARLDDGIIRVKDSEELIEYNVFYQDCTPYQAKKAHQLRLSFRNPIKEFGLEAYVIVRILTESH